METIANFPDLASAQLARSLLEAEGIPTSVPDEHLAGIDWRLGTAIQGIRLQVPSDRADEARQLLAATLVDFQGPDDTRSEVEVEGDRDLCPACGSDHIGPAAWKRRLKAATLLFPILLFAWPLLVSGNKELLCLSCGHTWNRQNAD
ncbi:MAG TPA: DUF2007 domain-containing protein [Thermoanaerobaculia bacterium]|nr:DUF2007 domain-containing protein [Thermoanaerobaculia bacterium]